MTTSHTVQTIEVGDEQLDMIKLTMLATAMATTAKYDELAKVIEEQGPEFFFECLATCTPRQILLLSKRVTRSIARQVFNRQNAVVKAQQEALKEGGVDGQELSVEDLRKQAEYQPSDYVDFVGGSELELARNAAELLYMELQEAYLIAEQVMFGWQDDYRCSGLPWISYQETPDSDWKDIITLDEALNHLAKQHEDYIAEKRQEDIDAMSKIKNIGKRRTSDNSRPTLTALHA